VFIPEFEVGRLARLAAVLIALGVNALPAAQAAEPVSGQVAHDIGWTPISISIRSSRWI
jgi:hypothetical protein